MREQVKYRLGDTLTREQADRILTAHGGGDTDPKEQQAYRDLFDSAGCFTDALFDWLGY